MQYINSLLALYNKRFPGEESATSLFAGFLAATPQQSLFTRKNFHGHITTSAFIINESHAEILLLRHKSLGRWLQPGGHFESDDTLLASALREAVEETGITASELKNIPIDQNTEVPFDIDSHYIPPNPKKQEDGHYHHDFRYLFVYAGAGNINYNEAEATGLKWVKFTTLIDDPTFGSVVKKIRSSTF